MRFVKKRKSGFTVLRHQIQTVQASRLNPRVEKIIDEGKKELKRKGLEKILKRAREFFYHGDGDVFPYERVMTFACFKVHVPEYVKKLGYTLEEAEPWIEVVPYVGMANYSEAGLWMSRGYSKNKNCIYVGNYPVGSLLELANPEATVTFYGTSAYRFGEEGKPVPIREVKKKVL